MEVFAGLSEFVMPVIKSNAYSHGIKEIAGILNNTNAEMLVVDSYHEAVETSQYSQKSVLILGYVEFDYIKDFQAEQFSFAVDSIETIMNLQNQSKHIKIHLEINSGMNRCGFDPKDVERVIATLRSCPNITVEGIFSHLADSDNTADNYTKLQTKTFDKCVEVFLSNKIIPKYIHLDQSAGSAKNTSKYANAIRPGIGIYGYNPLEAGDKNYSKLQKLQPILSVKSKLVKIFKIKKGDSVGYNCTFVASRDARIGLIPFGYYEGLPRSLSNKGFVAVLVNNQKYFVPIVGRICMNFVMVDLLDFEVSLGVTVEIICDQSNDPNSVISIAKLANTIPWEILTNLKSDIARRIEN
jgi:alanine racemase